MKQFIGKTISKIEQNGMESLTFYFTDDKRAIMQHSQDCCESVYIHDIVGDFDDLLGTPILRAECTSNENAIDHSDLQKWTFYKLATIKGYVTISWFGESNGYYSVDVDVDFEDC